MSLVAFALRQITILALTGKTLAGERVLDSEITALELRDKEQRAPSILVYTDDVSATPEGRDFLTSTPSLRLVLLAVVAEKAEVEGGQEQLHIPPTSAGLELMLDLIGRRMTVALSGDDDVWAQLWRQLVTKVSKVERPRGDNDKESVRFAAHQWALTCETLAEPPMGQDPSGFWADFLAALESSGDEELIALAPVLAAAMIGGPLVDWRIAQASLGLSREGVQGIGIAPAFETDDEAAPELTEVSLADPPAEEP